MAGQIGGSILSVTVSVPSTRKSSMGSIVTSAEMAPAGIVTESPVIPRSVPTGIASGVGGRVWFLGSGNDRVYSDVAPENSMANQAARAPSTPTAPSGLHVTVTGN